MPEKIILGYWNLRGLAHVSRLLLTYTGLDWEDIRYNRDTEKQNWFNKDKQALGIPLANLPYLIDGDFKVTESRAINLYIVLRSGKKELLGKDIKDQARVESVIGVVTDIKNLFRPLIVNPESKDSLPTVLEKAEPKLKQLDEFYGKKDFALGYLTLADFYFTELIYYFQKLFPELYGKYPFLSRILSAFSSIPEIKKYEELEA